MDEALPRGRHLSVLDADAPYPNRIRELRLAARLSQRKLGKLVGMSQSQLGAIERGMYQPTQQLLEALSQHLNCPTWHIFYKTSQRHHDMLIGSFERLSSTQREAVLRQIDTFIAHNERGGKRPRSSRRNGKVKA